MPPSCRARCLRRNGNRSDADRVTAGERRGVKQAAKLIAKRAVGVVLDHLSDDRRRHVKEYFEFDFWRKLRRSDLAHERSHYAYFYTTYFGLSARTYTGKSILDIGCGPLGSLEWATRARLRVGLDPLAHKYRNLSLYTHGDQMIYVAGFSEILPFQDRSFDYVISFNSLDHVGDVPATIAEMKRVVSAGGYVLLIVEIGHLPTFTEPHNLDINIIKLFAPEFNLEMCEVFGVPPNHNLWAGIIQKLPHRKGERGLLCAKLRNIA